MEGIWRDIPVAGCKALGRVSNGPRAEYVWEFVPLEATSGRVVAIHAEFLRQSLLLLSYDMGFNPSTQL
jgi:hypothetical protein